LFEGFKFLCNLEGERRARLKEHQRRIRFLERSLAETHYMLNFYITKELKERAKLEKFISMDVWVTADEYRRIHYRLNLLSERRTEQAIKKQKIKKDIDNEHKEAKLNAAHFLGIERALINYKKHMLTVLMAAEKKPKKANRILDYFTGQKSNKVSNFFTCKKRKAKPMSV
ncbi:hypothetical protein CU098_008864, partial [Rhizopus stolonifer]